MRRRQRSFELRRERQHCHDYRDRHRRQRYRFHACARRGYSLRYISQHFFHGLICNPRFRNGNEWSDSRNERKSCHAVRASYAHRFQHSRI